MIQILLYSFGALFFSAYWRTKIPMPLNPYVAGSSPHITSAPPDSYLSRYTGEVIKGAHHETLHFISFVHLYKKNFETEYHTQHLIEDMATHPIVADGAIPSPSGIKVIIVGAGISYPPSSPPLQLSQPPFPYSLTYSPLASDKNSSIPFISRISPIQTRHLANARPQVSVA